MLPAHSGAFRTGDNCDDYWEIGEFLSNAYYMFYQSTKRKSDFYAANQLKESAQLPLKLCKTRWVENVPVAARGIKLLPMLKRYIEVNSSSKSAEPKIKSCKK